MHAQGVAWAAMAFDGTGTPLIGVLLDRKSPSMVPQLKPPITSLSSSSFNTHNSVARSAV